MAVSLFFRCNACFFSFPACFSFICLFLPLLICERTCRVSGRCEPGHRTWIVEMASTAASGSPVVTTAARVGAATVRRSTRAWRRYCLRKLQQIASAADALLPPADQAEQESLLASLNEAAAVGIRPVRGFDVPGARYENSNAKIGCLYCLVGVAVVCLFREL